MRDDVNISSANPKTQTAIKPIPSIRASPEKTRSINPGPFNCVAVAFGVNAGVRVALGVCEGLIVAVG